MHDDAETNSDSKPQDAGADAKSRTEGTNDLPADRAYDLLRLDIIKGIQEELVAWGKRRFWVLSVIVIIVGLVGGSSLLTLLVESQVNTEVERYEKKFDELRDALVKSRSATKEAFAAADSAKTKLDSIDEEAVALESRVAAISNRLANATTENLEISEDLRAKVAELINVVNQLAKGPALEDIQALTERIGNIETSLDQSQADIVDAGIRAERGKYPVRINHFEGSKELVQLLEGQGYAVSASSLLEPRIGEHYSTIYITTDFPVGMAAPVIGAAREAFPFLRYMVSYSQDSTESVIYIGAATTVGSGRSRRLTLADFQELADTTQTQEEFYQLLRSFELKR